MNPLKNILVPFDDNHRSIQALEYAAMFATKIGGKITALHLADPKNYHSKSEFQEALEEMVNQQLRPKLLMIQQSFPDIVKIDLQIRGFETSLHRHILDFAAEHDIDFIIMRSHGLPDTANWELTFKTTNAYKVVLESYCPVFTFTQVVNTQSIQNILVPLDLVEGSLYKVPLAISLAKQFNAKVHLLSSSEQKEEHGELTQQLEEIGDELKSQDLQVTINQVGLDPLPTAIETHANSGNYDLVIIMNRPGFKWSDMWVSPMAKRVICHSRIPVISVRAKKPIEIGL